MMARKQRGIYEKVPGSDVWWIRFADSTGRIRREKAGMKSAAVAAYEKRKTQVREGKFFPEKAKRSRQVWFEEIARDALDYSRGNKGRESFRNDRWNMALLSEWFKDRLASEVTPQEIERRLAGLSEAGRTPATVNRYWALLSLTYSLAVRNKKVSASPVSLVRRRKENNERVRFLSDLEETTLREQICTDFPEREPEFDLALHTGLRRGEQFRLRRQDVDLNLGVITIPRSKHGKKRHVPINDVARSALERLLSAAPGVYIVPGLEGPRHRDSQRWLEECIDAAKIPDFHWHDLRHTFASRLVMRGVDLRTVQELMGHKTISMTVRYAHPSPAHLLDAVNRLTEGPTDTSTDTSTLEMVVVGRPAAA